MLSPTGWCPLREISLRDGAPYGRVVEGFLEMGEVEEGVADVLMLKGFTRTEVSI
jgi:hypothetical protein